MSQQSVPDIPLPFQLSRMLTSAWVPQAIYAVAALGIADVLADGPKRSDELAKAVGAHPGALHRLMRALVVLELCAETGDSGFQLTPLGACLRSDSPDSIRSWALLWGGHMWPYWGRLLDCVRTGETARKLVDGTESFEDRAWDPETARVFDQSMVELTRQIARAVVAAYDFWGVRTLVDVGGGYGELLAAVLAAHQSMRGVVFDLPRCRDGAIRMLEEKGVAERTEFVGGSFFEAVPAGADAYLLKSVIHDWNDERSVTILKSCRAAMGAGSRLLLVELVVPERAGSSPLGWRIVGSDLNMLVMTGGRERTEAEFRRLLEAAGLRVARVVATPSALSVIEAVPV